MTQTQLLVERAKQFVPFKEIFLFYLQFGSVEAIFWLFLPNSRILLLWHKNNF